MDCSPPGSSVRGIIQARILEGLPFPPPGDLPNPRINPASPALRVGSCIVGSLLHSRQVLYQVKCIKCILSLGYFQFMMGLSRCNFIVNQGRSVNENDLCAIFIVISKGKKKVIPLSHFCCQPWERVHRTWGCWEVISKLKSSRLNHYEAHHISWHKIKYLLHLVTARVPSIKEPGDLPGTATALRCHETFQSRGAPSLLPGSTW